MRVSTATDKPQASHLDFIRPSAIKAISLCNGRPRMEAAVVNAYGEPPASEEAAVGTILHAAVQEIIEHWKLCQETGELGAEWGDAIALTINNLGAKHPDLSSYDLWCLEFAARYARDLIVKHEVHPDNVLTEQRLDMLDVGIGRGGTADLVLVVPHKRVIVTDWKFGHLETDAADENDQTATYGGAAAATFKVREVEVHLVQPRAEKHARATAATFDANALDAQNAWTRAVVALASSPDPQLAASYDACKHCRALTRCKEAKDAIMNAQQAIALIGKPTDADAWGDLASMAKLAAKFGETGVDEVKAHITAGGEATGWKLQPSGSIKNCLNPRAVFERLEEKGHRDSLLGCIKVDIGKLSPAMADLVGEFIELKPKAPSLKPAKVGKGE